MARSSIPVTALVLSGMLIGSVTLAQPFIPIDHKGESPGPALAYVPNEGQVGDIYHEAVPQVKFVSYGSPLWLFHYGGVRFSFVIPILQCDTLANDSCIRIDMELIGELVNTDPTIYELDATSWTHNYYLPQCPQGVTDVHGYKRIVYEDVWPEIDFHLYSNAFGYKFYFVVRPGGDPSNILLRFHGQEELHVDVEGTLRAIMDGRFVVVPNAIAYQQIDDETEAVDWGADYEEIVEDQTVAIHTGEYDEEYPLIFDISESLGMLGGGGGGCGTTDPEWGTYYGGNGGEGPRDICRIGLGMGTCGLTPSQNFPTSPGLIVDIQGDYDAYYATFDDQYGQDVSTFFGGTGFDEAVSLIPYGDGIALLGRTRSDDASIIWYGPVGSFIDASSVSESAFIATFDDGGWRTWGTLFGHSGMTPTKITRNELDELIITGTVASNPWILDETELTCLPSYQGLPICDVGGQGFLQEEFARKYWDNTWPGATITDGFIAKFNDELDLVYSSLFGGNGFDYINDMAYDKTQDQIFLVGTTWSPFTEITPCTAPDPEDAGFPWCPLAGAYNEEAPEPGVHHETQGSAFVACLDASTLELVWCSPFNSNTGYGEGLAVDATTGGVHIAGVTYATEYGPADGSVPTQVDELPHNDVSSPFAFPAAEYLEAPNGFAATFAYDTKELMWSSYLGIGAPTDITSGPEGLYVSTAAGGQAGDHPLQEHPLHVYHDIHDASSFVIGVDGTGQFLGTYWDADDIRIVGSDRLYAVGWTTVAPDWTLRCPSNVIDPWCVFVSSGLEDMHCAQLKCAVDVSAGAERSIAPQALSIYPVPSEDLVHLQIGDGLNPVMVMVLDLSGRQLWAEAWPNNARQSVLYSRQWAPGEYLIQIAGEDGRILSSGRASVLP